MMTWIEEHWPKSTIFLAVYSTIFIFLFVLEIDIALFLIWIQLPVYWLHQFEEYVFPGGFIETFNRKVLGSSEKEWPMSKRASLWINIPIIYIAFPLSAILAGTVDISIGIWTAYFSILNAASHVGMFVIKRYNPGFFVSAFLNIPVGVFTVWYFYSNDVISVFGHLIGVLVAVAVQGGLMVWGLKFMRTKVKKKGSGKDRPLPAT
jgi:hypothetical protein